MINVQESKKYDHLFTHVPTMNCVYAITVNDLIIYIGATSNLRQVISMLYYDILHSNSANCNSHRNNLLYDFLDDEENYTVEVKVIEEVRGIKKKTKVKNEAINTVRPPLNYRIPILDTEFNDDYETQLLLNTVEETMSRAKFTVNSDIFSTVIMLQEED